MTKGFASLRISQNACFEQHSQHTIAYQFSSSRYIGYQYSTVLHFEFEVVKTPKDTSMQSGDEVEVASKVIVETTLYAALCAFLSSCLGHCESQVTAGTELLKDGRQHRSAICFWLQCFVWCSTEMKTRRSIFIQNCFEDISSLVLSKDELTSDAEIMSCNLLQFFLKLQHATGQGKTVLSQGEFHRDLTINPKTRLNMADFTHRKAIPFFHVSLLVGASCFHQSCYSMGTGLKPF